MVAGNPTLARQVDTLVADYRTRCLWFLRADSHPVTRDGQLRVLDDVQRYGDRDAHVRIASVRSLMRAGA